MIPLNNCMRWNSWFIMLNIALEDQVKALIQLYIENYKDTFLEEDLLTISK
jgi:hypothetical protein